jgi:tRNA pseudouridine55 synthase
MDGLLVVDKPAGPTSHDVVARMRRVLGERRIGHTGTLVPFATGVLPLVVGRATRLARFLAGSGKSYDATIRLGFATDTGDATGTPLGPPFGGGLPSHDALVRALEIFRGTYLQRPPAFSAKKIGGRRSYDIARRARAGTPPGASTVALPPAEPAPVLVTVNRLDLVAYEGDLATVSLDCSAGYYVRALARDLGDRLGVGAHLAALRRTRSGGIDLSAALPLDAAERRPEAARAHLLPLDRMLEDLPAVRLTPGGLRRALHGQDVAPGDAAGDWPAGGDALRLLDPGGRLVGVARPAARSGVLHPVVVLS